MKAAVLPIVSLLPFSPSQSLGDYFIPKVLPLQKQKAKGCFAV